MNVAWLGWIVAVLQTIGEGLSLVGLLGTRPLQKVQMKLHRLSSWVQAWFSKQLTTYSKGVVWTLALFLILFIVIPKLKESGQTSLVPTSLLVNTAQYNSRMEGVVMRVMSKLSSIKNAFLLPILLSFVYLQFTLLSLGQSTSHYVVRNIEGEGKLQNIILNCGAVFTLLGNILQRVPN